MVVTDPRAGCPRTDKTVATRALRSRADRVDRATGQQVQHREPHRAVLDQRQFTLKLPRQAGRVPRRSRCAGKVEAAERARAADSASGGLCHVVVLLTCPEGAAIEQDRLAFLVLITDRVRVYAP